MISNSVYTTVPIGVINGVSSRDSQREIKSEGNSDKRFVASDLFSRLLLFPPALNRFQQTNSIFNMRHPLYVRRKAALKL